MALLTTISLTTVATAKSHLNIPLSDTTQDARIELFINAASKRIESYTGRALKSRAHVDIFHGRRQNILISRQWPITAVTELRVDQDGVFTDPATLIDATEYAIADDATSVLYKHRVFPNGYNNVRLSYVGGYLAGVHDGELAELELACLWLVEWFYRHRFREDMGRTSKSKGDESTGILDSMPTMIREIIDQYRRYEAPGLNSPIGNV